jgi:KaiC/GvpD/RAD55 family RecA-like ATPase
MKNERVPTGIYGLDDLMGGGLRENTINVIRGGTTETSVDYRVNTRKTIHP